MASRLVPSNILTNNVSTWPDKLVHVQTSIGKAQTHKRQRSTRSTSELIPSCVKLARNQTSSDIRQLLYAPHQPSVFENGSIFFNEDVEGQEVGGEQISARHYDTIPACASRATSVGGSRSRKKREMYKGVRLSPIAVLPPTSVPCYVR